MESTPTFATATKDEGLFPAASPSANGFVPASSGQRRLWFLEQMEPGSPLYHIPYLIRLRGRLDECALSRALNAMVERHEALRTNFTAAGSTVAQIVAPTWSLPLPVTDLTPVDADRREGELRRLAQDEAKKPFDLQRGLMLRVRLFRLGAEEHALMLVMHHIASDGWSMAVLYREIGICYEAYARGAEPVLPELPLQYADFSDWQEEYLRGETLSRLVEYWKNQMQGAPALLELPTDRPRPPLPSHRGDTVEMRLPAELMRRLKEVSARERVTLFMMLLAAFDVVLHRHSGQTDVVVGSPLAGRDAAEMEGLVGFFINTLPMRTKLDGDPTVRELLARVREATLGAFEHRDLPFEKLVEELQPQRNLSFDPICQVFFALQNMPTAPLKLSGLELAIAPVYTATAKSDLTVWATEEDDGSLAVTAEYALDLFERDTVLRLLGHFRTVLDDMAARPDTRISALTLLTPDEREDAIARWNATQVDYRRDRGVHELFEEQVARTPEAVALVFDELEMTYAELNARADRLAATLRRLGAGPDVLVGICVERSLEMMVALLAIHKAGSAYVPLDPTYPAERIAFMLRDSRAPVLVTQRSLLAKLPPHEAAVVCADDRENTAAPAQSETAAARRVTPDHLAYVLYTSGSTGQPKGVMVTHRNVVNFFAGMDRELGREPGVWLAVTSISFDISVLELFWTLTRGYKVVILADAAKIPDRTLAGRSPRKKKPLDFSLFYFASDDDTAGRDRYRLLLEGAKFADEHGFRAVWTPERHFHSFGGLYPNPAVTGAAIAATTRRVQIRAGSVVSPLHHPARIAEEWSVVDNLSQGRVGLSFASGWHDRDFTLRPETFAARKDVMCENIETVRRLWRGESVGFKGGRGNEVDVKIFPRPVQRELPVWITAAGNPETFRLAGEMGTNVLTHLLGQDLADLERKIALYRAARREHGHDEGCVTIALHTFVGDDLAAVREQVREPLMRYLADSADLLKGLTQALYPGAEMRNLTAEETRALVEFSFNRYFELCGLLGTPATCRTILARLEAVGVDEVACLIDFGVETDAVLQSLRLLDGVREEAQRENAPVGEARSLSLVEQVARHGVTHLQCTPSFARLLVQSPDAARSLGTLRALLVGGEAFPVDLAQQLRPLVGGGEIINMYGPTETTIWSSTQRVTGDEAGGTGCVSIGRPIANTQIYVLDAHRQPVPVGVPGELWIGGDGVARGYWQRSELTDEKFARDPFVAGNRMYRTGDLGRRCRDGAIDFIGRVDHQVKIRGHRIELGEIEAALMRHGDVRQAVVVVRSDRPDDPQLVAYVVAARATAPEAAALRDFLRRDLPEYMLPAVFVTLERLPLTPNGKVDRKALPAPTVGSAAGRPEAAAPLSDVERSVAAIWRDILRVEQIGADDNFFDFGGHSLQVVQVQNRLRETVGVDVPILQLFQHPTIRSLARFIGERASAPKEDSFRQKIEERTRRRHGAAVRLRETLVEERA
jgi:natural product biosynthesis luciferase-like monooxygenase protein